MSIRYSKIQNLIIYIGDIIGITIGYFLMANFRYFYVETSVWIKDSQVIYRWMVAVFVLTIVYLAINPNQGFFKRKFWREFWVNIKINVITAALMATVAYLIDDARDYSRFVYLMTMAFSFCWMQLSHMIYRWYVLKYRPYNAMTRKMLIITTSERVKVGETIEIKTGGRVPLDGMMLNEVAAFNTAALTGESVPRSIRMGEEVLAGMIVTDKVIRIKVIRPFDKSALARILELVQNASERKAPAELFIRKFARVYTPIVIGLAVLIVLLPFIYSLITPQFLFTFNDWLYRALVFLVISCPCALVVSIPLGYFGGIGAASRLGILFKGGNYLDAVTKINTVVFDKTGTLTKGTFEVQSCNCESGVSEEELIRMIASVESSSTHPIAKAVVNYAGRRDIELSSVTDSKEYAGLGLEAAVNGIQV